MTFNKRDLTQFEGFGVPDLIGEGCQLLFVGINPGLWTAASGVHFAHPTNRFWPAMRRAGLVDFEPNIKPPAASVPIVRPDYLGQPVSELRTAATQTHFCDPSNRFYPASRKAGMIDWTVGTTGGMANCQRADFVSRGMGITNLVSRATVRASELTPEELRQGGERLTELLRDLAPAVVAVAGITAYRVAFSDPRARVGSQAVLIEGTAIWAVPNPSGLNAHETVDSLAGWYRKVATAASLA